MTQDVVSLLFPGDADALLPRYQEGLRRYGATGGPRPEQIIVSSGEQGLMVTLVWPDGVSHETLGEFMRQAVDDLGLPFPRADHGALASSSWSSLTAATV